MISLKIEIISLGVMTMNEIYSSSKRVKNTFPRLFGEKKDILRKNICKNNEIVLVLWVSREIEN